MSDYTLSFVLAGSQSQNRSDVRTQLIGAIFESEKKLVFSVLLGVELSIFGVEKKGIKYKRSERKLFPTITKSY